MATPPDFTTGQVLTAAQMNAVGLWLISSTTLTGTTQNFTDVFSNDYDNYKIVISNFQNSTSNASLTMQMRTSAGVNSTVSYSYGGVAYTFTGTGIVQNLNAGASFVLTGANTSQFSSITLDLFSPNLAKWTTLMAVSTAPDNGRYIAGNHQVSTAYSSFQLASTGGMTGRCSVYGYNQ